jgi:hypothetical protein
LDITELQHLRTWNDTGIPGLPAISRDSERPVAARSPDHLWIYRPDRDEAVSGPAVLRG